ncbi:hypothetical protein N7481_000803 [Penicillium waksmanii]|uniref:uncharacterized protein n=1 Tax=Penicillium waksmanii TaxID=69791 RepID=UPI0025493281|nr:uncharacterized protein N7481_000803 [Penicillium waksmanii]KAJ6000394.1 hypothetical protein N7481_000803 [Penicillium waksmanii]
MGGMIDARCGLMYPESVNQLFLAEPLGLEDWVQVVQNFTTLKKYELYYYFHNLNATWKPDYDT